MPFVITLYGGVKPLGKRMRELRIKTNNEVRELEEKMHGNPLAAYAFFRQA